MKAKSLVRQRIEIHGHAFAELVIWQLAQPLAGSTHAFKYRLAFVVNGTCVLRYDNEAGKGDHRHWNAQESSYRFTTPSQLMTDFFEDIQRYQHEHPDD